MSDFENKLLQHELAAAETEIRELRRKLINEILDLFKIEHMAKKDLERAIKDML